MGCLRIVYRHHGRRLSGLRRVPRAASGPGRHLSRSDLSLGDPMLRVELSALIGRLNAISRQGLEQAALLCAEQQAPEISAGHLLLALIDQPLCDLRCLLAGQGVDIDELRARLAEETRPPRNLVTTDLAAITPSFSPLLVELLQDAWLLATTEFAYDNLRSGLIFTALLHNAGRYLGL